MSAEYQETDSEQPDMCICSAGAHTALLYMIEGKGDLLAKNNDLNSIILSVNDVETIAHQFRETL